MGNHEEVIASANRAADRRFRDLQGEVLQAHKEAAFAGAATSSRFLLVIAKLCKENFAEVCAAAAVRIAEAEGEGAIAFADSLGEVLAPFATMTLQVYQRSVGKSLRAGKFGEEAEADLKAFLANEIEGTQRDLRLGVAGGVNVKKQHSSTTIDIRGGANQLAVNSPGSNQSVRGNMVGAAGVDPAMLLEVLDTVRGAVASAPMTIEHKEEIEDAVALAESEAKKDQPNEGRIVRALKTIAKKGGEFGLKIGGEMAEHYLRSKGLI